ncbi:MAG TPA: hypothetical protein VF487_01240 [Chitinophagaceae bacterium]
MKLIPLICLLLVAAVTNKATAQGCVAIRSNGNTCSMGNPAMAKGWQLNFNNRYFKSYKHFVGTVEQKEREENHTEVINHSYSLDITATRYFNTRWSMAMTVPILSNTRSSLYEHAGNAAGASGRHSTRSFGIGDIRVSAYRWLMDPAKHHKGNIQAGLGIKLPTGDYRYQDYFYKADGTTVMGPVDQSIQLGDGGTGFTAEINGYYNISHKVGAYGNLFYLVNPREQNGVSTARGGTPNTTAIQYFTSTMSVPDQYMARGGVNYMANKFTFSGGIRIEGIPSSDLVGGDKGFRRPGIVIAAEPVIAYQAKKINVYVSVPVALQRNRTQSYSDKLRTAATGTKVQGDAAFADYSINAGLSFRF